jgi:hypothetical protein
MAAGDQVGCALFICAATPARCGADMDVPERGAKLGPRRERGTAARMSMPGPTMSGFSTPPLLRLGPQEENTATLVE